MDWAWIGCCTHMINPMQMAAVRPWSSDCTSVVCVSEYEMEVFVMRLLSGCKVPSFEPGEIDNKALANEVFAC